MSGSQLAALFNDAAVGLGNVSPHLREEELILNLLSSHPSTQRLRNILPLGMKGPPSHKIPLCEGCQAALVTSLQLLLSLEPPPSATPAGPIPLSPSQHLLGIPQQIAAGFAERAGHSSATMGMMFLVSLSAGAGWRSRFLVLLRACLLPASPPGFSFFCFPLLEQLFSNKLLMMIQ